MKTRVKVQMMAAGPLYIALITALDMPKPDLGTAFLVDMCSNGVGAVPRPCLRMRRTTGRNST